MARVPARRRPRLPLPRDGRAGHRGRCRAGLPRRHARPGDRPARTDRRSCRGTDVRRARIAGQEPIPLLADVLTTWPDVRVNVDVKSRRSLAAGDRCDRAARRRVDRVCVGAFADRAHRRGAPGRSGRGVCTAVGPAAVVVAPRGAAGEPARRSRASRRPRGLGRTHRSSTPRFVDAAHALGLPVHVYTVNDPSEMRSLLDLGVDGIMTDRADLLARGARGDAGAWPRGESRHRPDAAPARRGWYLYGWASQTFPTVVTTVFMSRYLTSVAENAVGKHGRVHPFGIPVAPGQPVRLHRRRAATIAARRSHADRRRHRRPHRHASATSCSAPGGSARSPAWRWCSCTARNWQLGATLYALALPRLQLLDRGQLLAAGRPVRRPQTATGCRRSGGRSPTSAAGSLLALSFLASLVCRQVDTGSRRRSARPACGGSCGRYRCTGGCRGSSARRPARRLRRPAGRRVPAARRHDAPPARLPADAGVPGRVPGLQRRHPDRDAPSPPSTATSSCSCPTRCCCVAILLVQFVAFAGAHLARPAGRPVRREAGRARLAGGLDGLSSASATSCSRASSGSSSRSPIVIALVLGGSQALSRSLFSRMIPPGVEAEYFAFYEISDSRDELARAARVRADLPEHRLVPRRARLARRVLRRRLRPAAAGARPASGRGRRQRGPGPPLTQPRWLNGPAQRWPGRTTSAAPPPSRTFSATAWYRPPPSDCTPVASPM